MYIDNSKCIAFKGMQQLLLSVSALDMQSNSVAHMKFTMYIFISEIKADKVNKIK